MSHRVMDNTLQSLPGDRFTITRRRVLTLTPPNLVCSRRLGRSKWWLTLTSGPFVHGSKARLRKQVVVEVVLWGYGMVFSC